MASSPHFADLLRPCVTALWDQLSCEDMLHIRASCRDLHSSTGPRMLAAAAFAASRVRLPRLLAEHGGPPFWQQDCPKRELPYDDSHRTLGSITQWLSAWQACVRATDSSGQHPDIWTRFSQDALHSKVYDDDHFYTVYNCTDMVDRCLQQENKSCLGILALHYPAPGSFFGLLLLSQGFALCEVEIEEGLQEDDTVRVFVHTADRLSELAWSIDDAGRLKASMEGARRFDFASNGVWLEYRDVLRRANDGELYSLREFQEWYGPWGREMWRKAPVAHGKAARLLTASRRRRQARGGGA